MSAYLLERRQFVPGDLKTVFGFFKNPGNLGLLTPPWLRFRIVSTSDATVRNGTELAYRIWLAVFPMTWRSLITEYEEDSCFADEMLSGPYKRWYHRHLFRKVEGGVEIVDRVEYEMPFGLLGRIVHALAVRFQLKAIFDYRTRAVEAIFEPREERGTG